MVKCSEGCREACERDSTRTGEKVALWLLKEEKKRGMDSSVLSHVTEVWEETHWQVSIGFGN